MEMGTRRSMSLARRVGLAALLTALSGCTAAPYRESSTEEATVTGTVKLHGKLLDGGELNFNAVNPNRKVEMRKATIGKDGTYTAKAYIGLNTVTLAPRKAHGTRKKARKSSERIPTRSPSPSSRARTRPTSTSFPEHGFHLAENPHVWIRGSPGEQSPARPGSCQFGLRAERLEADLTGKSCHPRRCPGLRQNSR